MDSRSPTDYGLGRPDDLMAGIGYGKYSARQVLARLAPAAYVRLAGKRRPRNRKRRSCSVVRRVFGGDNDAIRGKAPATCWSIGPMLQPDPW